MLKLLPPDKKIKLTKQELYFFKEYIDSCCKNVSMNEIKIEESLAKQRFIEFFHYSIQEKIINKLLNSVNLSTNKEVSIKINYGEELTLLILFGQNEGRNSYDKMLINRLLLILKPTKLMPFTVHNINKLNF